MAFGAAAGRHALPGPRRNPPTQGVGTVGVATGDHRVDADDHQQIADSEGLQLGPQRRVGGGGRTGLPGAARGRLRLGRRHASADTLVLRRLHHHCDPVAPEIIYGQPTVVISPQHATTQGNDLRLEY